MMESKWIKVIFSTVALCCAGPAFACRPAPPMFLQVQQDYDGIAIGVVDQVAYSSNDQGRYGSWSGTARITQTLIGPQAPTTQVFGGQSGGLCNTHDGQGPPPPGERWVFYYRLTNGKMMLARSYPFTDAAAWDSRLLVNMTVR
jgi:hypothetical protein